MTNPPGTMDQCEALGCSLEGRGSIEISGERGHREFSLCMPHSLVIEMMQQFVGSTGAAGIAWNLCVEEDLFKTLAGIHGETPERIASLCQPVAGTE